MWSVSNLSWSMESHVTYVISASALEVGHSVTNESHESSGNKLLMDGTSGPLENVIASSSDNSERLWCSSLLLRST